MSKVIMFNGVEYTNKREVVKAVIEAGGATTESICEVAQVDAKGLASQMSYLRLTGVFPMKDENGIYRLGTAEEAAERAAARSSSKPRVELTPEQRLERAVKRENRAATAHTTAQKRFESSPTRETELRLTIATAELELASILLGAEQSGNPAPSVAEPEAVEDENLV